MHVPSNPTQRRQSYYWDVKNEDRLHHVEPANKKRIAPTIPTKLATGSTCLDPKLDEVEVDTSYSKGTSGSKK